MTPEPIKVGQGATYHVGSDRYPYTVIRVLSDRRVEVQADNYRRTDTNGISESQTYEYTPNPEGRIVVVSRRKNGAWKEVGQDGCGFSFRGRNAYQDPSF